MRNPERPSTVKGVTEHQEASRIDATRAILGQEIGSPADERALVRRAAAGDAAAFERLVAAHAPFVYNVARRTLGHDDEADDAAQEAFLRAWRGLPRFDGRSAFRTWLYRIAVRVCCDRRPGMLRRFSELGGEDDAAAADLAPKPEGAAERAAQRRRVRAAVDGLPAGYRMLVALHYLEELRYDEIAALTGMPLGSLKVALHRARARLRVALSAEPDRAAEQGPMERWP